MISYTRASFTTIHLASTKMELATTPATIQLKVNGLPFSCKRASSCSCNDPGHIPLLQWMSRNVPTPIKAILLVFVHLREAHWYYAEIEWLEAIFVPLRWVRGAFESYNFEQDFRDTIQGCATKVGDILQIKECHIKRKELPRLLVAMSWIEKRG
jgi:hypothetical protein